MKLISPHITYAEATKSKEAIRLGLDNTPGEEELESMIRVANALFEPVRKALGCPIPITSFFRSPEVNKAAHGSPTSDHMKGRAIDMDLDGSPYGKTNKDLFEEIFYNHSFDQLIWEFGDDNNPAWVHGSYRGAVNRREVKRAIRRNGETMYLPVYTEADVKLDAEARQAVAVGNALVYPWG